nr:GDSL esterase/lipase At5g62930 [Ipomoea trifida]
MEPRTIMYSCFCFTEWNGRDDLVQHVEMDLNFTAENLVCVVIENRALDGFVGLLQQSITYPAVTTIFFGANDAALSGRTSERQHVPLEEYKENLRKMVQHLKHSKSVSTGTLTLGLLTTVLSVVYSSVRAGSSTALLSPPSSPRAGGGKPLLTRSMIRQREKKGFWGKY